MKNSLAALVVGFIFSIGLGISGMTQPQKVIGFLDIFGDWDPSLMFVMVSAIGIHFLTYRLIRKRSSPVLSSHWHVPNKTQLTPALMIGAFVFGVGWALAGFCPGPAITSMASFEKTPYVFVISMLIGMYLFKVVDSKLKLQK